VDKRVFVIHRWDGSPYSDWLPWIKRELESLGYAVDAPYMPNPDNPEVDPWVYYLREQVGRIDDSTFFIGHSIGCQAIMRYASLAPENERAGGAVFVAPWITLKNIGPSDMFVAKDWLERPIDFPKASYHLNKITAIFSETDPFVPMTDAQLFQNMLHANIVIEQKGGHFTQDDGVLDLQVALSEFVKIANSSA